MAADDELAQVLRISKAEEEEKNAQRKRKLNLLRIRMQRAGMRFIDKNQSPSIRKFSTGGTMDDGNCFWRSICQGRAGVRKVNGKRVSMQKRQDAQRWYMRLKQGVARHMKKNRTTGFNYEVYLDGEWDQTMQEVENDTVWHRNQMVEQATATYLKMTISQTKSTERPPQAGADWEDTRTLRPRKTNGANAKSRGTIYLADYAGVEPGRQGAHYVALVPTTRAKKKQQSKKGKARAKPAEKKKAAAAKKVQKKEKAAEKKAAKKKAAAVKKAAAKKKKEPAMAKKSMAAATKKVEKEKKAAEKKAAKKKAAAVKKAAAKKKKEPAMAKKSMAKKRSMAKKSRANKK